MARYLAGDKVRLYDRRTGVDLGPGTVIGETTAAKIGLSHPCGGYTRVSGENDPYFRLEREPYAEM